MTIKSQSKLDKFYRSSQRVVRSSPSASSTSQSKSSPSSKSQSKQSKSSSVGIMSRNKNNKNENKNGNNKNTNNTSNRRSLLQLIIGICLVAIGYFLGCQHALIVSTTTISDTTLSSISSSLHTLSPPTTTSTSSSSSSSSKLHSSPTTKKMATKTTTKTAITTEGGGNDNDDPTTVFRLHDYVTFTEDRTLYDQQILPKVQTLLSQEGIDKLRQQCSANPKELQPYLDILTNIITDRNYYETKTETPTQNQNNTNQQHQHQHCPVVFIFYIEGGTKMTQIWLEYYANIQTKRCLNFIVHARHKNDPNTKMLKDKYGYTIVGSSKYPRQDKAISMSLVDIQKQYGDDVLVSVNDLDHLLVWFTNRQVPKNRKEIPTESKPYRYSTYTDIVLLYVYELLSTPGCSNQNVHEKYVIPCTCLMENNKDYISTVVDPIDTVDADVDTVDTTNPNNNNNITATAKKKEKKSLIWSEYGTTNRFHPTGNFYLNRENYQDPVVNRTTSDLIYHKSYPYSIGTVYANLRKYERDIITHHKIGYKSKKIFSRAKHCGVVHARSDNMIQSLSKYHHFLEVQHLNTFRDSEKTTINDALKCSVVSTRDIIANETKCRKVKEFANILAIGHQKRACLLAGYSEHHCLSDMTCCLTY